MPVLQGKRNKSKNNSNNNNNKSVSQLQVNAHSLFLLLSQLTLLCMLFYVDVVRTAELPAELMLEGVSLLKSMEYAQQKQQQQQQQHQQQQQQHPHIIPQKSHMLHGQTKRFPFDTVNAGSTDVDIDTMQLPEMSPADIARFERELFLQSALDETSLMSDDMELPMEPNSMEQHADLMERTIDYKQHQPTGIWSQQHGSSGGGRKASSTFLQLQHPHHLQQQQQQQQQQQHQHPKHHQKQHLSGGDTASANSVTLAPPPSPVAAPQRHCAIEISTKLTGVCQAMAPVGTACVAGDYMDVYNEDCM